MKFVNIAMTDGDYEKLKQGAVNLTGDSGEPLTVTEYCRYMLLTFNEAYLEGKIRASDLQ